MGRQTTITRWADRIIEAGWLLALVFTPYYFNLLSARHFEPDKALVLRSLVLVMLAAWAVKTIERSTVLGERPNWKAWWRAPLAVSALVYAGIFVAATLLSVRPSTSWWGSYQRGQGTYTNLSYIALFALIVGNLRSREQLQRLVTTVILTGVSVSVYGMVQHYGLDPLPWKGNVITRISSTMGNSIFVAAYLIMVVPWVLYRLTTAVASLRSAAPAQTEQRLLDWTWLGFTALLLLGQQALLLGILKFMVGVRPANGDFRYWWVLPLALVVIAGSFVLVGAAHTTQPSKKLNTAVLAGLGSWTLLLLLQYAMGAGSQRLVTDDPQIRDWALWLMLGIAAIGGALIANYFLPARPTPVTRTFAWGQIVGYAAALTLILLAIFFSQSRGPWIGGMVGIGVFVYLLLLSLLRLSRERNMPEITRRLRLALYATVGLGAIIAGLLITFNLSSAPIFERLRDVPYVGRLGRLLETGEGTGRVRTLIWFGDEHGGGVVGLLRSNLARTLTVGHGPETMFTVYNPFYPPELARYEARGASPDRSHQAWLDELVTKGLFGLLSYFVVFGSAIWLALRQLRRSTELRFQLLAITVLATLAGHFVEVLVGIPIVATLTMLWTSIGVLVVAGLLQGLYTLDGQAVDATPAAAAMETPTPERAAKPSTERGRGRAARGGGRTVASTATTRRSGPRWAYPVLLIGALSLSWFWNLRNTYADMFLNQAQSFTPRNFEEEAFSYQRLLRAVEIDPTEDYYYLQLGNSLLKLIYPYKLASQQTFDDSTAPRPNQRLHDLFAQRGSETERVRWLVGQNSTEQMFEYARLVLEQAYAINPTNKDHPANLGRLFSLWGRRANGGTEKLEQAVEWFEVAHRIAPNDAAILNELATNLAYVGRVEEAESRFKESLTLDPRFSETYARLGELYRVNGRLPEAAQQFAAAVERNRSVLEAEARQLDAVLATLKADPQALGTLRDAFEQQKQRYDEQREQARAGGQPPVADPRFLSQLGRVRAAAGDIAGMQAAFDEIVQANPRNIAYRQLYTQTLSDTLQYGAAMRQAEEALALAQQQGQSQQVADLQKLVDMIRAKAGG